MYRMAKIEVYSMGSERCQTLIEQANQLACSKCSIVVHDMRKEQASPESENKAKEFGLTSFPAVVMNGKAYQEEGLRNLLKSFQRRDSKHRAT
ncbi:glutaredoxin [Brevibacillus ruminantium]|uniref:Glutaredoxin n=1 Tax=Brevibacillus ruminantium TaxID=2950604 RepID=A0ABY4WQL9_9BACL|nr:glutaredoxin [Brevibacillus ruminantium]USG66911.1 glutaredoxin [Brevibacillus ruminantium]